MEARNEEQEKFGLRNIKTSGEDEEEEVIKRAIGILKRRMEKGRVKYWVHGPDDVKHYLRLELTDKKVEFFGALLLNAGNGVMEDYRPFQGGVTSCAVYVGTLMRRVLEVGANAVVLYHNHPSGRAWPSNADINLTQVLYKACGVLQVELLDHLIIGEGEEPVFSFGESGELARIVAVSRAGG